MPEPFLLLLQFTNLNSSERFNLIIPDESEEGYRDTEILTDVDNSELPYRIFTVRVAMMINGVVGDFTTESQTLGMTYYFYGKHMCSNTYIYTTVSINDC